MSTRIFLIIAVVLSVILHLVVFEVTAGLELGGLPAVTASPPPPDKIPPVRLNLTPPERVADSPKPPAEEELPPLAELPADDIAEMQMPDGGPEAPLPPPMDMKTSQVAQILKDSDLAEIPETLYKTALESAMPPLPAPEPPKLETVITAPPPEILEIPRSALPEARQELPNRQVIPQLDRQMVDSAVSLPSLAMEGPLMQQYPPSEVSALAFRSHAPQFALPAIDDPSLALPGAVIGREDGDGAMPTLLPGNLPVADGAAADMRPKALDAAVPLDEFVEVVVTVRRDQAGAGGCFQVAIRPNANSESMPDIPKDVIFIIDRSGSISLPKLNEFKDAVARAIPLLGPQDRFNVISFSDRNQPIFRGLVPASEANSRTAIEHVRKIPHGGLTDVFKGLAPFISGGGDDRRRPLNIFLLTDGRSTVNVYEPNVFLKQIVTLNPGNVSVFPFSAGSKANRFLLDYLGYLNRGRNRHADRLEEIRDSMAGFFAANNRMLVTSLQCQVISGAPAAEIFPRWLPNLYRGERLLLYGRFRDVNDEIVLLVKGRDASGQLRDLLFRRKLSECPVGDEQLSLHWAAQKLLYLHARRNSTDNPAEIAALDRQIAQIQSRYPTIFVPR